MPTAASLADSLTKMPAQPLAAVRVVRMIEDPDTSAVDLARLIETDPALSARVMRLANAPYYGLTRKVSSAARAVVLLGFSTVRALAVSAACGLLAEQGQLGPPGYWPHSVATAAGSSVVARALGASPGDAFSAGLLHDLGAALLYRESPLRYTDLLDSTLEGSMSLANAELATFGVDHSQAGAEVLDAWRFPRSFVRAIESHHQRPEEVSEMLGRVVIAGEALALQIDDTMAHDDVAPLDEILAAVGIEATRARRLVAAVKEEIEVVAAFLEVDG